MGLLFLPFYIMTITSEENPVEVIDYAIVFGAILLLSFGIILLGFAI
jgi:hypothetical protein